MKKSYSQVKFCIWLVSSLLACSLLRTENHYENMPIQIYWKFHHQRLKVFRYNFWFFFHISAQNRDCGYSLEPPRRGVSNEYPQSLFLSRNKTNNVLLYKPQFYYIKVGLRGSKLHRYVFVMSAKEYLVKIKRFVFLLPHKTISCAYSLEAHRRGASNEHTT